MTPKHLIIPVCVSLLALSAACGDDDSDGGGSAKVDTGLPPGDKLSSLDGDDAMQACTNTAKSLNRVLSDSELERISCVFTALDLILTENDGALSSDDIGECKDTTNDCLKGEIDGQDFEIDVVSESDCEGAGSSNPFEGCDATVADYENCASKVASELRARLLGVTCDALKDPDKLRTTLIEPIDVSESSQCKALQTKCPDVALSGSDEED